MKHIRILTGVVAALALMPTVASADFTINFDTVWTGDSPVGDTPWATLTVSDVATDTVEFELTNNTSLSSDQFISKIFLNTSGSTSGLTSAGSSVHVNSINWGDDAFRFAGLDFDGMVEFDLSNKGDRLLGGQTASWQITRTGLTSSFFNVAANNGPLALVKFQGINGSGSGHVSPVPEPASFIAIGTGALMLLRRRKKG